MRGAELRQRRLDFGARVALGAGAKRAAQLSLHERGDLQQIDRDQWRGVMVPGGICLVVTSLPSARRSASSTVSGRSISSVTLARKSGLLSVSTTAGCCSRFQIRARETGNSG